MRRKQTGWIKSYDIYQNCWTFHCRLNCGCLLVNKGRFSEQWDSNLKVKLNVKTDVSVIKTPLSGKYFFLVKTN